MIASGDATCGLPRDPIQALSSFQGFVDLLYSIAAQRKARAVDSQQQPTKIQVLRVKS